LPTPDDVCRVAADRIADCARQAIAARGRFCLVLAGGSTPRRLYQLLARPPYRTRIDWSRIEFFWGDERPIPPEHADSNYGLAYGELLSTVPVATARIHRMPAEDPDLALAADRYERELAGVFAAQPGGEPPVLDLVLLGMGADGHTASLFPHTAALRETRRWIVANNVPQIQSRRMTMTHVLLNRARHIVFLVSGAAKSEALAAVLEGSARPEQRPARLIEPIDGQLTWLVDREAIGQLQQKIEQRPWQSANEQ
jgi:6-phosphogluconolactonase